MGQCFQRHQRKRSSASGCHSGNHQVRWHQGLLLDHPAWPSDARSRSSGLHLRSPRYSPGLTWCCAKFSRPWRAISRACYRMTLMILDESEQIRALLTVEGEVDVEKYDDPLLQDTIGSQSGAGPAISRCATRSAPVTAGHHQQLRRCARCRYTGCPVPFGRLCLCVNSASISHRYLKPIRDLRARPGE